MSKDIPNSADPYIFWLFDWDERPIHSSFRFVPCFYRCDIGHNAIILYKDTLKTVIPFQQLELCKLHWFIDAGGIGTTNLKLTFRTDTQTESLQDKPSKEIYLVPVDVLTYDFDVKELKNMNDVIHALWKGDQPSLVKNPYHRTLIRQGKSIISDIGRRDPTIAPNVYRPAPNVLQILGRGILMVIGVTMTIAIIIGIIYNLLY